MRTLHSRSLLSILAVTTALAVVACSNSDPDRPPNIVLFIIDTLRADKLSSYGYPADTSPALTRLAERGVQFDKVTAQTSWTMPSIGSMLTSRYPRSLGLYAEDAQMVPNSADTLAELLKRAGYVTFGITANPNLNSRYNFQQGFDEYHESIVVFGRTRDQVPEGKIFHRDSTLRTAPDITQSVLEFAKRQTGALPSFIQIDVMEVHEHFKGKLMRPEYKQLFKGNPSANYLRMIRQVTDDTEVFVNELTALAGWENTLFVITSDHGEGLTDHPGVKLSNAHGALLYESQLNVPWIMFNPSWQPERSQITQRVRLLDLVPTILDYAGIETAGEFEGVSLMPLVNGAVDTVGLPEFIVTETSFRHYRKVSAIGDEWQFIDNRKEHPGLPTLEYQRLGAKPNGIATDQSAQHADDITRMQEFIADWEAAHPLAEPTPIEDDLDEETRAQLESVGYLGEEEDEDEESSDE